MHRENQALACLWLVSSWSVNAQAPGDPTISPTLGFREARILVENLSEVRAAAKRWCPILLPFPGTERKPVFQVRNACGDYALVGNYEVDAETGNIEHYALERPALFPAGVFKPLLARLRQEREASLLQIDEAKCLVRALVPGVVLSGVGSVQTEWIQFPLNSAAKDLGELWVHRQSFVTISILTGDIVSNPEEQRLRGALTQAHRHRLLSQADIEEVAHLIARTLPNCPLPCAVTWQGDQTATAALFFIGPSRTSRTQTAVTIDYETGEVLDYRTHAQLRLPEVDALIRQRVGELTAGRNALKLAIRNQCSEH